MTQSSTKRTRTQSSYASLGHASLGHASLVAPVLALAVAAFLVGSASPALAQQNVETASCAFLEIQASNDGEGTDPRLLPLTKTFERPPLSAWKKFTLLAKHDETLTLASSEEVDTTSKAKLEVLYEEYSKGKKERFKLSLTFKRPDGKKLMTTSVTVDAGDYLVISMPSKQHASNFLAITCKR